MAEAEGKDWRKLCAAAASELDPDKLVALVDQIIQALDENQRITKAGQTSPAVIAESSS